MLKWVNKKRNKKGFTLVELVVVIAILGILAMVAVPKFTASQDKAKLTSHLANIRVIEGAIAMYEADKGPKTGGLSSTDLTDYISTWPTKPGTYTLKEGTLTFVPTLEDTEAELIKDKPVWNDK